MADENQTVVAHHLNSLVLSTKTAATIGTLSYYNCCELM